MINLTNMTNEIMIENKILDVKDTFEDFDLCIKYLGNDFCNEVIFIKQDFDLKDDDIVAVAINTINSTVITLRRVIKIGDFIQLRDIKNFYTHITINQSEEDYKIIGKAIYKLRIIE